MEKKKIIELRGKAQQLRPTVQLGKDGMTPAIIDELSRQLKKNKLVKVKLLSSFEADRYESAERLAHVSSSVLIEVRGKTVVLAKE
jgi:RNA-binding protein